MFAVNCERSFYMTCLTAFIIFKAFHGHVQLDSSEQTSTVLPLILSGVLLLFLLFASVFVYRNNITWTILVSIVMFLYSGPLLMVFGIYVYLVFLTIANPRAMDHAAPTYLFYLALAMAVIYLTGSIRLLFLRRKAIRILKAVQSDGESCAKTSMDKECKLEQGEVF